MMARITLKKMGYKKFRDEGQDLTTEEEIMFEDKPFIAQSARRVRNLMKSTRPDRSFTQKG